MERNLRKTKVGVVHSNKMDKTITIKVVRSMLHPKYGKFMKKSKNILLMMKKMSAILATWLRSWRQGH